MTRIDDLAKQYPAIPRELILKWELWNRGINDTDDIDKISKWVPAEGTYQNKFDEVSLKERVTRRPSRLKDGRILRPNYSNACMTKKTIAAPIVLSKDTPYEFREFGDGKFAFFEGEEKVDIDLYFPQPKAREGAEPVTSKGTPISRLLLSPRNCFVIMPVRHCEYFGVGEQCKFCNFNTGQEEIRALGLGRPATENLDETVEAYKIRSSEVRLVEGRFELGGFANSENEERIHTSFVERIANAAPYKPFLLIHTEALTRKGMQRLKDVGLDSVTIQLEVWDPQVFAEMCPGKVKHMSYQAWLDSINDAVDIFGVGNVACKTIGGTSLVAESGHKTWQEARDTHIEHIREMCSIGAIPSLGCLRLPVGSVWGGDPSLREKLPPTEYYLDLFGPHHEAMTEHGLYDKLNKFMYCGFDCAQTVYCGDIGIFERAGDWGHWMADVVPDKANWLLQWLAEIESPVEVKAKAQ
ncbi:MAG: hypothetical protein Q7O66_01460 [Dehalococcoidia bacterium]|nr:hypothetical protein [Dehalococcoidia bacterium]